MRIYFASSEALPFSKTGGLADVASALPKALAELGHEVAIFLPMYLKNANQDRSHMKKIATFDFTHGMFHSIASLYSKKVGKVTYYFIEHQNHFEREAYYGYDDDGLRFSFFQIAILEAFKHLKQFPDILHGNDWQTGMLPTLTYHRYGHDERYHHIRHVFTIHNLAFQGVFPASVLTDCLGLPAELGYSHVAFHHGVSFLKAAIMDAHHITTVSPTYAKEILTDVYGEHMQHVLQANEHKLSGILNGIDYEEFNPEQDSNLIQPLKTLADKAKNKLALQEFCQFRKDKNTLLLGMVTRLSNQKGVELVIERIHDIMAQDVQFIVLGSGEAWMEDALYALQYQYPRRFFFYRGYNEALAHRIYAGIDAFLMPSRFEPCGISQMIAMRYQTLVYARKTGGLVDTVIDYNYESKQGYGFTFQRYEGWDFITQLPRVINTYYDDPKTWQQMIKNVKKVDFSFEKSAIAYEQLYKSLR